MNANLQGPKEVSAEPGLSRLQTEFVLKTRATGGRHFV